MIVYQVHARLALLVEVNVTTFTIYTIGRYDFRYTNKSMYARLAQLVEQLIYTEKVGGSSPSPRTKS